MKCSSCSAPLGVGKAKCTYCGTTNDVDLLGKHHFTTTVPEVPRPCPGCGTLMKTVNAGTDGTPFYIERCEQCLGLFFDPGELDSLIEHSIRAIFSIDRLTLASLANENGGEVVQYRKCPICAKYMNRNNFGRSSGVIVDECRDHGLYLDAGELHRILKWVRAGGKLSAKEEAEAVANAEARRESWEKREQLSKEQKSMGEFSGQDKRHDDSFMEHIVDFVIKIMGLPRL